MFNGRDVFPQLFLAPRGLITVLLFFAIPENAKGGFAFEGVLLFVILGSCLIMTWSLVRSKKHVLISPIDGECEEKTGTGMSKTGNGGEEGEKDEERGLD